MSPLFLRYCLILIACLATSGVLILVLERGFNRSLSSVKATYFSWLIMVPIALLFIAFGRLSIIAGFLLLSFAGFLEYAKVSGLSASRCLVFVTLLGIFATATCVVLSGPESPTVWLGTFQAMPAWTAGVLVSIPVLQDRVSNQLHRVALAIAGYIYLGWMMLHGGLLANSEHSTGYILFLLFAVGITDVSAFTFGSFLGRRPLRPKISPNKTIEGAIGALVVAMLLPWLLRFSFPSAVQPTQLILIGLIIGIGAQLGDLSISVIKRDRNVKDTGDVIPGHGGILDRIDSLVFTTPIYYHTLNFFDCL